MSLAFPELSRLAAERAAFSSSDDLSGTAPGESWTRHNGAQARLIPEVARMYYEERRTQREIANTTISR